MPVPKPPPNWLTPPDLWRVLVVEDQPEVCHALVNLINWHLDFEVCKAVPTAGEAMKAIAELKPDAVTTGIEMPGMRGIEFTRKVAARWPKLPVLVLSAHPEYLFGEPAIRAGARGYVTKEHAVEKLPVALRRMIDGDLYVSNSLADRMAGKKGLKESVPILFWPELMVLNGIASGYDAEEIADLLDVTDATIENYRNRIKGELKRKTSPWARRQAMRWLELQAV